MREKLKLVQEFGISIHALLAESDLAGPSGPAFLFNFYPRSPCGERQVYNKEFRAEHPISIHALLAESDGGGLLNCFVKIIFLSTLSLRRATISVLWMVLNRLLFLSTLSLRRATAKVHKTVGHFCAYETNFMGIASSC